MSQHQPINNGVNTAMFNIHPKNPLADSVHHAVELPHGGNATIFNVTMSVEQTVDSAEKERIIEPIEIDITQLYEDGAVKHFLITHVIQRGWSIGDYLKMLLTRDKREAVNQTS